MKRIMVLIGLGVTTVLANSWAGSAAPPVGTWEVKKPDGFAFFTFEDGGTVTGYGGGPRTFGLFNATGTWAAVSGVVTGSLVDLAGNSTARFKGKATATKLSLHLSIDTGRVSFKGKPAVGLPDASGLWTGTVKHTGDVANAAVDITPSARLGVFDVAGTDGTHTIAGELLLSSQGKSFAYLGEDGGAISMSLAGKLDAVDGTATLSGIDTNRHAVKINLAKP